MLKLKSIKLLVFSITIIIFNNNVKAQTKQADKETAAWRYEIECIGIGQPGTKIIKVWSYSKKANIAINQAKKNAVHGIIFKGYTGSSNGCSTQKPLANDPSIEHQKYDFFEPFFADGGKYMKFVTMSGDATPEPIKVGKEYKVGIIVTVMSDLLRKDLESAGIIKSLNSGF